MLEFDRKLYVGITYWFCSGFWLLALFSKEMNASGTGISVSILFMSKKVIKKD